MSCASPVFNSSEHYLSTFPQLWVVQLGLRSKSIWFQNYSFNYSMLPLLQRMLWCPLNTPLRKCQQSLVLGYHFHSHRNAFFSLIESYKKIYTKICLQFWREKMVIGFCDSERACPFLPLELSEHSMIRQIWESDKKKK